MASFQRQTGTSEAGGWLVILNKSLADSELHRLLSTHKYRLRGESLLTGRVHVCMPVQSIHTQYSSSHVCMLYVCTDIYMQYCGYCMCTCQKAKYLQNSHYMYTMLSLPASIHQ